MTWWLSLAARAALLLAFTWLAATFATRASAATRHRIWALGVGAALLLPALSWGLPELPVAVEVPATGGALVTAAAVAVEAPARAAPSWSWLAVAWTAGSLLVGLRFLRAHVAAERLAHAAGPVGEVVASIARRSAERLGLSAFDLGRDARIDAPMTVGVLRPRVLLPAGAEAWSVERLGAVLTHELGHVSRHDTRVQLAAQLLCALYWWNPLTWLAASRLRVERELACDDLVLDTGVLASRYAEDLLAVASGVWVPSLAAVGLAGPSETESRLRRILDPHVRRGPVGLGFRVGSGLSAAGLAAGLAAAAPPPSQPLVVAGEVVTRDMEDPSLGPVAPEFLPPKPDVDTQAVLFEVNRHVNELAACYQRRLAANPALAGTVSIHWTIGTNGRMEHACITEDGVGDPELLDCVNQLVADTQVAPRSAPVGVQVPFVFTPPT